MKITQNIYKVPFTSREDNRWGFSITRSETASGATVEFSATPLRTSKLMTRDQLQQMHLVIIEALQDWRD